MDMTPKKHTTARALGFAGHLALLVGYVLTLVSAGGSATALILSTGAVLAGFGWIRAAPDERLLPTIGGWALALAPLLAIWLYGALWPTKGAGGSIMVGSFAVAWLVFLFNLLAGIGILRIQPRPGPTYLFAGVGLLLAALMTLIGIIDTGWTLVMLALVVNAGAQALAAALFWPPAGDAAVPAATTA